MVAHMPVTHRSVALLRRIALAEGVSFLVLLGIAMPLKYLAGMGAAVRYVGWAHGLLFIALCLVLVQVLMRTDWPLKRAALVFVAALLPFGPFVLDRRMREWENGEGLP
jgi:integral membrane protein